MDFLGPTFEARLFTGHVYFGQVNKLLGRDGTTLGQNALYLRGITGVRSMV